MVVALHRGTGALVGGEVVGAGAEVDARCGGGVVDVLRVLLAVVVGVDADVLPRAGDELHRADRTVPDGVLVELAVVGVGDLGDALAVERDAVDAGLCEAVGAQCVAVAATVVGLDATDGGDEVPRELAAGVGLGEQGLGASVGVQRGRGDAVRGERGDGAVGPGARVDAAGRVLDGGRLLEGGPGDVGDDVGVGPTGRDGQAGVGEGCTPRTDENCHGHQGTCLLQARELSGHASLC